MDAGARWRKIAALALLGVGVAFFLMLGVGETMGGDVSGVQHFPPAAILAALLYVGWKRPFAAGIVLLVLGVLLAAAGVPVFIVRDLPLLSLALLLVLPSLLTGLLLVQAGRHERGSC